MWYQQNDATCHAGLTMDLSPENTTNKPPTIEQLKDNISDFGAWISVEKFKKFMKIINKQPKDGVLGHKSRLESQIVLILKYLRSI